MPGRGGIGGREISFSPFTQLLEEVWPEPLFTAFISLLICLISNDLTAKDLGIPSDLLLVLILIITTTNY